MMAEIIGRRQLAQCYSWEVCPLNFLKKHYNLLNKYDQNSCCARNNAFLYGVCQTPPPLATHIVFAPMPEDVKLDLVSDYKRSIPAELMTLYDTMNGANYFWSTQMIGPKNIRIPFNYLSIYGVPLTWDRQCIEPFNIRTEDLNRPKGTPESWLKFGSYYRPENIINRLDLFVDTDSRTVYAVEHDCVACCVYKTWHSIDSCLCCLLDLFEERSTGD